jgi:Flp pilus assembly pilin Flp
MRLSVLSLRRLTKPDDGQDLLEYGLLASLIAIFAVAAVRLVGDTIGSVLWAAIANNF